MTEPKVTVSVEGLARFRSAARDHARVEIARLAKALIEDLRSRPAEGVFGEVGARHLWDEYCWSLQEGPFHDELAIGDVNLGSLSDAFAGIVRASIAAEVEKLPKHAQIFLSALAFDEDAGSDEQELLGSVWLDGVVSTVMDTVNEIASRRNLDLIGPDRGDALGYHIEGCGLVWSALSEREEAMDLIAGHVDTMIEPDADLSALATKMVDAYMGAAKEAAEDTLLAEFLERFEVQIRSLIRENDVLPSLEDMRGGLLERLDG